MAKLKHIRAFAIIGFLAANAVGEQAADQHAVDWLRGSGKDLQICLKGKVFEKHLRKMLLASRQNLSDAEIGQLVESVRN